MKLHTVSPIGHALRIRLSYEDLCDMRTVDRTRVSIPNNQEELCYAVFNGIAWDLNEMIECNPDHIPKGWDGRKGDIVFRNSRDYDDQVIMARIAR